MAYTTPDEFVDIRLRSVLDIDALNKAINTMQSKIETSISRLDQIKKNSSSESLNYLRSEQAMLKSTIDLLDRQAKAYQRLTATKGNQGSGYFSKSAGMSGAFAYDSESYKAGMSQTSKMYAQLEKEQQAFATSASKNADRVSKDQVKAAKEAERAWSKTFMGAIEGGTTFGHKLATTFQYATAGTAFYALAGSISAMTQAFLDADKAMHMFRGVLELTDNEAQQLQGTVFSIGTTYGGQLKDLNEAALALGRAGIATKDLGTALKSVSQLSLVSGESLGVVTDVMVSWATLYPEKKIGDLGDIIVKVANESKASVADFNTMSTYILTAGQQAGLTAEAVASLAGAFKQIGKGSSTSGTEIRRFFQQLESGSDDVRKAYSNLNINMDQLRENLLQGGDIADSTMVQLFEKLRDIPKKEGQKAIMHIEEVLDKATLKSLLAVAKSGQDGLDEFKRILDKAKNDSKNSAEKAASEVALSYSVAFERIKNTAFASATEFGNAFTKTVISGITAGDFDKYVKELTDQSSMFMKSLRLLGETLGFVINNIDSAIAAFITYKGLIIATTKYQNIMAAGGFVKYILSVESAMWGATAATTAWGRALDLLKRHPIILGLSVIAAGVTYFITETESQVDKLNNLQNKAAIGNEKLREAEKKRYSDEGNLAWVRNQIKAEERLIIARENSIKHMTNAKAKESMEKLLAESKQQLKAYKEAERVLSSFIKKPKAGAPSISGKTSPKDKDLTAGQMNTNAQQELDSYKEIIKAAEQEWFLSAGINDELNKKRYSLETTLPALKAIAEMTIDQEKRSGEIAKVEQEIAKTKLEVLVIERGMRQAGASRIQDLQDQDELSKDLAENQKILTAYTIKEAQLQRELGDSITSNKYTQEDALAIYNKQLATLKEQTAEQLRILEVTNSYNLQNYEKTQSRVTEDLKLQTGYEKYRKDLLRESEDIADSFYLKAESGKQITELDVKQYEDRLKLIERSDYSTYVGMQMQQEMQSVLNSGLSNFFNIQSEGWLNFEKLGMSVLTSIMNKMLQMQVIDPLATAGASGIGSMISGFFSAQGNVVGPNGKIPMYAKGGTFTNSIVSKPTMFAHGGGFGIMGEAGPESIMPLKRSKSGDLGVVAIGANNQPQQVTVQIRNESGESLAVTKSEARTDMSGMVIDIIIDAVARNKKGMRDVIRGGR